MFLRSGGFAAVTALVSGFMLLAAAPLQAAEVVEIAPGVKPKIDGKEVDWIYGDTLLKNEEISLVIAAPLPTRDANLTVRNIGGSILDLTLNKPSNDQLSAFIPTAGRYYFHDPKKVKTGGEGDTAYWQCTSSRSATKDGTTATVRYSLSGNDPFVTATLTIEGEAAEKVAAYDGVRADGVFSFSSTGSTAYCSDAFFRQTIGFQCPDTTTAPTWKRGRPNRLQYGDALVQREAGKLTWTVRLYPATSTIDLISVAEKPGATSQMVTFTADSDIEPASGVASVLRAKISLLAAGAGKREDAASFQLQTSDKGMAHARLTPGKYIAVTTSIGFKEKTVPFEVLDKAVSVAIPLGEPSGLNAVVTSGDGMPVPFKATFYGKDGSRPSFGPSATRTFVENCVYAVHGKFHCPLKPGEYEVYFSRGPEFASVRKEVTITAGEMQLVEISLPRVIDTPGWVSADLHSHSSPSGDNTSDQYGRVENLICEHLEFAPCTEHARVSSYTPHLQQMKLEHLMATCTGIEVTGSPLPVNHQNSFPLLHRPHTQNGGGPRTSANPVLQIERVALWDKASDKVVQMNHPNLHQIHGDADTDGKPDKGFRGMLKWTDVIEVHPLATIFQDIPNNPPNVRTMRVPLFQWMQLLNYGYRIPGAINTDAHYNHHGSGGRRIWIASSTDDPAKISTAEMVRQIEAGHIVMSTGPYLSVKGVSKTHDKLALPGDDLIAKDGKASFQVSVQCPDWIDVNRVQVFINGRASKKHNYTRRTAPELFGDLESVQKFKATINVELEKDAHIIIATIGEGLTMEKIMGSGKRAPIAVANPIFVDVDGKGFQHNHDDLGLPLPGADDITHHSHPHPHPHDHDHEHGHKHDHSHKHGKE